MKASDLNGQHLGHRITVAENGNSATGVLRHVEHTSSIVTDETFGGRTTECIGATWVTIQFLGGFTANVTPKALVTAHG